MIICGFAGIGKSYYAHHYPNVMDLESTPFEKDWNRYAKCAKHYSDQGYLVLTSCHKEFRKLLIDLVPIHDRAVWVPDVRDKDLYKTIYISRNNTEEFIKLQMNNWEDWLNPYKNGIKGEKWVILPQGITISKCIERQFTVRGQII